MKPSEVRAELLAQHQKLRTKIEETRCEAERCASGIEPLRPLKICLCELANAMRMHNLREEELLRDILPDVDAWGRARTDTMLDEHVHEHQEIYAALMIFGGSNDAAPAGAAEPAAAAVLDLVAKIGSHIAHEEQAYLADDVLTESTVPPDSFTG
jgi:hypothetical protein